MRLRFVAIVAALLAFTLTAAAAHKKDVKFNQPVSLNGTNIAAGEYKVEWDESGNVKITQDKKVVASGQAKLVALEKPSSRNSFTTRGSKLTRMQFEGSKTEIVFEGTERGD